MRNIPALVLAAITLFATGCGVEPEACSEPVACGDNGKTYQACCNTTDCRYTMSNGKEEKCDGTDCSKGSPSAADKVVAWCME